MQRLQWVFNSALVEFIMLVSYLGVSRLFDKMRHRCSPLFNQRGTPSPRQTAHIYSIIFLHYLYPHLQVILRLKEWKDRETSTCVYAVGSMITAWLLSCM